MKALQNYRNGLCILALVTVGALSAVGQKTRTIPFSGIKVSGELKERVQHNFDRLEESKYHPANVFLTEEQSGGWPGDTEGRTILGLVMDAQASGRTPKYLEQIIDQVPSHLNEKGYMGPIYDGTANEQQLSGNGWMLRGLCEYYLWKHDERVLNIIQSIATNLYLPLTTHFNNYPIAPNERQKNIGSYSGNIAEQKGQWMLSSDIGCVFIGMDGLIQAYGVLKDNHLKAPIEALIKRFLAVDLIGIKAQTHATLTACRGLVRYAEITGKRQYISEAATRFNLYVHNGMTENFENYNWFGRYDTWTEPCAIVDSYILAVELWQHTGLAQYRDYAELIYYNAICTTQRFNGGFGCDTCPGLATGTKELKVSSDEAHWCCTMRGGEGLGRAVSYAVFSRRDNVELPFYRRGEYNVPMRHGRFFKFHLYTDYPMGSEVRIRIEHAPQNIVTLKLAVPEWMQEVEFSVNGEKLDTLRKKGFVSMKRHFHTGDEVKLTYKLQSGFKPCINNKNTDTSWKRAFWGPLMLCNKEKTQQPLNYQAKIIQLDAQTFQVEGSNIKLTPIYHMMDRSIWSDHDSRQVLF